MGKPSRFSKSKYYALRTGLGLNHRAIMRATGVSHGELSQFEKGHIQRNWKTDKAIKYMEGLRDEPEIQQCSPTKNSHHGC